MKWSHFAVQVWDANGYFTAARTVWTEPESPIVEIVSTSM